MEDAVISWLQKSVAAILKHGPVPKHIGFIMDGNRRYARDSNIATIQGHAMGYTTFCNLISLGLELGVKEITTYALSIENLKRSKDELGDLWNLMEVKFTRILNLIDEYLRRGVVFEFIGDLSLMPHNLQILCAKIYCALKDIQDPAIKCYLAICYTSRNEITTSIKNILTSVKSGLLQKCDIDDKLVQECLYKSRYPVDMIIRTSGETRLSDFLLWQCSDAVLYFTDILWPAFGPWEMFKSIVYFQHCRLKYPIKEQETKNVEVDSESEQRIERFAKFNENRHRDFYKNCM